MAFRWGSPPSLRPLSRHSYPQPDISIHWQPRPQCLGSLSPTNPFTPGCSAPVSTSAPTFIFAQPTNSNFAESTHGDQTSVLPPVPRPVKGTSYDVDRANGTTSIRHSPSFYQHTHGKRLFNERAAGLIHALKRMDQDPALRSYSMAFIIHSIDAGYEVEALNFSHISPLLRAAFIQEGKDILDFLAELLHASCQYATLGHSCREDSVIIEEISVEAPFQCASSPTKSSTRDPRRRFSELAKSLDITARKMCEDPIAKPFLFLTIIRADSKNYLSCKPKTVISSSLRDAFTQQGVEADQKMNQLLDLVRRHDLSPQEPSSGSLYRTKRKTNRRSGEVAQENIDLKQENTMLKSMLAQNRWGPTYEQRSTLLPQGIAYSIPLRSYNS